MAAPYKYLHNGSVLRIADQTTFPPGTDNPPAVKHAEDTALGVPTDPADPLPTVFGRSVPIQERRVTTVGTTPAEIFRSTITEVSGYQARVRLTAIADNLSLRAIEAIVVVARGNNGALIIPNAAGQTQTVVADHRSNATAASWLVTPSAVGNDYVITVTGSAGRTVDWRLVGTSEAFMPGGES